MPRQQYEALFVGTALGRVTSRDLAQEARNPKAGDIWLLGGRVVLDASMSRVSSSVGANGGRKLLSLDDGGGGGDAVPPPVAQLDPPQPAPAFVDVAFSDLQAMSGVDDAASLLKGGQLDELFEVLPTPDAPSGTDFSILFHESDAGDMAVRVAKRYPQATVVAYEANAKLISKHVAVLAELNLTNTVIGRPKAASGHDRAHDITEQVVLDLRSSLDLFDYQVVRGTVFTSLLHHNQSSFESFLGQTFSLARTTFISVPYISSIDAALSLFHNPAGHGPSTLQHHCYETRAKPPQSSLRPEAKPREVEATAMLLGFMYCAADAANVEIRARLLQPLTVDEWIYQREVMVEVTLVSMKRFVGGLFRYGDAQGQGPQASPQEEAVESSVAARNFLLEYQGGGSERETLSLTRKDGLRRLMWMSTPKARSATVLPVQQGRGVSVFALVAIRALAAHRRALFQLYVRDVDNIISAERNIGGGRAEPWATYLYRGSLFYVSPFARTEDGVPAAGPSEWDDFKKVVMERSRGDPAAALSLAAGMGIAADMARLQRGSYELQCSFVEHGAENGFVGATIGRLFPKSSVILITDSPGKRRTIDRAVWRNRILNSLTLVQGSISAYASHLYASPEHFNFQLISGFYETWLHDPARMDTLFSVNALGELLACADASYFVMPHPKILSLAFTCLFGPDPTLRVRGAAPRGMSGHHRHHDHWESAFANDESVDPTILDIYELAAHPNKTPLRDWDFNLLESHFDSDALGGLAMQRVPMPRPTVGATLADVEKAPSNQWILVRVAPTQLKRTVQHHFQAELDGHKRKYLLRHVWGEDEVARATNDELAAVKDAWSLQTPGIGRTWLERTAADGGAVANNVIPYTHFGMSLITLLRMGVSEKTKTKLYGQFLQIPVYEDMATWNIQWTNGKLAYVDVDTMQRHLEGSLPHAYVMILALMNYERTVNDFGRCETPAKVAFGIPFVGSCVRPRDEYRSDDEVRREMKCSDNNPVPCSDGECKPTFVHCLRDLYEKEVTGEVSRGARRAMHQPTKQQDGRRRGGEKKKYVAQHLPDQV